MRLRFCFAFIAPLLTTACAATHGERESTRELAQELEQLETTPPDPPIRIPRATDTRTDVRGAPLRPTGSAWIARYSLRDVASGKAAEFEAHRTASQLHVHGAGQEWFFERNPVAHEEVTGLRVDLHRKLLIEYPFTDLIVDGYARSWSSLARLGVDPDEIPQMRRTGRVIEALGLRFDEYIDESATGTALRELLWSDEHQIPLRSVRTSGLAMELESLSLAPAAVATPSAREAYPDFAIQDVADWREAVHDH